MLICFTEEELKEKYVERSRFEGVAVSECRKEVNYSCLYQAIAETLPSAQLLHILTKMDVIRNARLDSKSASIFERQCFGLPLSDTADDKLYKLYGAVAPPMLIPTAEIELFKKPDEQAPVSTTARPSDYGWNDVPPLSGQSLPVSEDPGAKSDSESHE